MPAKVIVTRATVLEGIHTVLSARVLTDDSTPLVSGDITALSTITVNVYDISDGGQGRRPINAIFTKTDIAVATGGPGGIAVVPASGYSTTYWDGKDGTGHNFVYRLLYDSTGATGPDIRGGHKYQVEFSFSTTAFGTMRVVFVLDVTPIYSA